MMITYSKLCKLFGKKEVDKHLNNAVRNAIEAFYLTKERKKANSTT